MVSRNDLFSPPGEFRRLHASDPPQRVWPYFAWTLGLSTPFWLLGSVVDVELAEGVPISGLMVVCPALAASIVSYRSAGRSGVSNLWSTLVDRRRKARSVWNLVAAAAIPAALGATYVVMGLTGTAPSWQPVTLRPLLLASAAFFVAAITEELGWTAFATDVLQRRRSALTTALMIGAVWAVWHWIPLVSAGRSAAWIAWWSMYTVACRVLIVWLYNHSAHMVWVAVIFHAMSNVATVGFADFFDPALTGLIVAAAAVAVTARRRPATLDGRRPMRA